MGISRECFFSALFAKAKALSKKIHSRVSGGNVEKDSLMREISEFNNIMEDRLGKTLAGLLSLLMTKKLECYLRVICQIEGKTAFPLGKNDI